MHPRSRRLLACLPGLLARHFGVWLCALLLALAPLVCGGCQTEKVETSDGRPMPPPPRQAPVTPSGSPINRLTLLVGQKPEDANRNGYPDLLAVTVMLWSEPYPTPLLAEGSFIFSLWAPGSTGVPDAKPLGEWTLTGDAVTRAQSRAMAGPCYQFRLSLLDIGGEIVTLDRADLTCRFQPADGSTYVASDGVRTIQVGRRGAKPPFALKSLPDRSAIPASSPGAQ